MPDGMTLAEFLFAELGEAIARGDLPPGSKISEPLLARRYGVSRGPLREALHRLQERKLITRTANQGARVTQPTSEGLRELFVLREALEGMAAREAAQHVRNDELAAMHEALARHEAEIKTCTLVQPHAESNADRDFHFLIAQASRNPMLIDLLCSEFYPLLRLYRGKQGYATPRQERALVEHRRILDAITERDPDLAEQQMRRHIASARRRREEAIGGS